MIISSTFVYLDICSGFNLFIFRFTSYQMQYLLFSSNKHKAQARYRYNVLNVNITNNDKNPSSNIFKRK